MPLLVSILQGWSHIRKIGKCEFGKTLLTQRNSCARRFVLSAKSFFLFPISLYFLFCASLSPRGLSRKFLVSKAFSAKCLTDFSHEISHWASDVYLKICVSPRGLSRKFLVLKAFSAKCLTDFSHEILHWASDVYLKICVGYAFSKWSSAINKGFKKEEKVSFRT